MEEPVAEPIVSEVAVPACEGAVVRVMGLDPSMSCGVAIVQLNDRNEVLAMDVGVLDVSKKKATAGSKCNELQRQLAPLLVPPPDVVYLESYFVHPYRDPTDSRWTVSQEGIDLNYKLRGALEMALDALGVPYEYVAPQTWKKEVVHDGGADKQTVRDAIELMMGQRFHARLFSHGRWNTTFRFDASDAAGVALYGTTRRAGSIAFAPGFTVASFGLPKRRAGLAVAPAPVALVPVMLAPS